jgi:transposase
MFPKELLPSRHLRIEDVQIDSNQGGAYLTLSGSKPGSRCPRCGAYSERVRSAYERHLTDLPCSGLSVEITLYARRFLCTNVDCRQKTFVERWPGIVVPYGRRSERLDTVVSFLAQSVGVRSSHRVLKRLQANASLWSILRVLRRQVAPRRPTPRILGVDDWALRRGRQYGTLLANLESGQVVDVLPDREAETLATWLKSHPGVEVISRDGAGVMPKEPDWVHRMQPRWQTGGICLMQRHS